MKDKTWKGVMTLYIILAIIAVVVFSYWLFNNTNFTTVKERAIDFCRDNGMGLENIVPYYAGYSSGICVRLYNDSTLERNKIVYLEGIKNWVFDVDAIQEDGQ